ncbi:MAG TPA: ANTAR domain-containing protein [Trebonia sp.]|nr:ANTAR domain-containing protein [Trebonia sp.]
MNASGSAGGSRGEDEDVVVRKVEHGWVVGDEEVSDLTSAMVLADLFAADQNVDPAYADAPATTAPGRIVTRPEPAQTQSPAGRPNVSETRMPRFVPNRRFEADEAQRLAVTVTQLEHALASRVMVEQAIGVLAERHRLRPRDAFDLLRGAARSRGQRITDMAQDVVASTANPLLRLPEELARQVTPKQRGRSLRRSRRAEQP